MTTKNEIFELGRERGFDIASWTALPENGYEVPKEIDWIGIDRVESFNDAQEVFFMLAHEDESNSRCYSPFEFTANELNLLEETADFEVWDTYDEGIRQGIEDNWESRKDYYDDEDFE